MADYERRVKESLDIEMQVAMAKMNHFFESKLAELDQKRVKNENRLLEDILAPREILSPRDDVENAEMIDIRIQ